MSFLSLFYRVLFSCHIFLLKIKNIHVDDEEEIMLLMSEALIFLVKSVKLQHQTHKIHFYG